jgi:hypothetical protein
VTGRGFAPEGHRDVGQPCHHAYSGDVGKILLVVLLFAGAVYAFFWLLERRRQKPSGTHPARPTRVVAPDDDEDFLRELERRRRREARDPKPQKPQKPAPGRESSPDDTPDDTPGNGPGDGPADKGRSKPE